MGHVPDYNYIKNVRSVTGVVEVGRIIRADDVRIRVVQDEPAE